MFYTIKETPVGALLCTSNGKKVIGLHWTVFSRCPTIQPDWKENQTIFQEVFKQLDEYFHGKRQTFTFPYEFFGTDFQKSVWRALEDIPYGEVRSYQTIAQAAGRPNAVRAVGTAIGSNPISIVVPCHRVLGAGGRLAGYAGGLECKAALLALEARHDSRAGANRLYSPAMSALRTPR